MFGVFLRKWIPVAIAADQYHYKEEKVKHLPITHDLNLRSMRAKELNIWVWMFEERYNQPPCLGSSLNLNQFLLDPSLIHLGMCTRICLLYQLWKCRKKSLQRSADLKMSTWAACCTSGGDKSGRKFPDDICAWNAQRFQVKKPVSWLPMW